jgi:hypothetical protein
LSQILEGRKVVLAAPPAGFAPEALSALGAKGILILDANYHGPERLAGTLVRKRFGRLKDVYTNNCEVAILHGNSSLILSKKYKFQGFEKILVPLGFPIIGAAVGLLRYAKRGDLILAGRARLSHRGREASYLVLNVKDRLREVRRQFAPAVWSPLEIVRSISDLDLVVLRGAEKIAASQHSGDIDVLIASHALAALKERFGARIGTYPVDVYTEDGSSGHTHNAAPYYAPDVAKRIINSAALDCAGIRVASSEWQFISYCYHVLFHGKLIAEAENAPLSRQSFRNPNGFDELERLASLEGRPIPQSVLDLESVLRGSNAMPSLDLVGFYSHDDPFLKHRYFNKSAAPPGLATFFVRDFGHGLADVGKVREQLNVLFEILAEGPVTDEMRVAVRRGVRGGNWTDSAAEGGHAEPVYWFVCWDPLPKPPSRRTQRKHPRVDNENVRIKDQIRSAIGKGDTRVRGLLHSSDNTCEALDHLEAIGILTDEKLAGFLRSEGITVPYAK